MCKKAIITGAAGFIGSHAAARLLGRGYGVVGVDNFCDFYPRSFKEQNADAITNRGQDQHFSLKELDILDGKQIRQLVHTVKPDVIVHLAALAGVRPSIEWPSLYARVNVEGTTNLLHAAVESGVKRFVFASSSSVYGNNSKVPFAESDDVSEPISPYAATKRAGELICHAFHHLYKLPVACLRFFTVYGPRQRPDLAIHKFARLIHFGRPIPVFGDGSTSRDYTYIDDIVSGVLAAHDRIDQYGYRIWNLGGSDPVTLSDLIAGLERALGKKAIIDRKPRQQGDVERTYADLARSRAELDYRPTTRLQEGLNRFAEWFLANVDRYRLPDDPPTSSA